MAQDSWPPQIDKQLVGIIGVGDEVGDGAGVGTGVGDEEGDEEGLGDGLGVGTLVCPTVGTVALAVSTAANPAPSTLPSDVKASTAVLESTVTLPGACEPLKVCIRLAALALLPRYTFTKS